MRARRRSTRAFVRVAGRWGSRRSTACSRCSQSSVSSSASTSATGSRASSPPHRAATITTTWSARTAARSSRSPIPRSSARSRAPRAGWATTSTRTRSCCAASAATAVSRTSRRRIDLRRHVVLHQVDRDVRPAERGVVLPGCVRERAVGAGEEGSSSAASRRRDAGERGLVLQVLVQRVAPGVLRRAGNRIGADVAVQLLRPVARVAAQIVPEGRILVPVLQPCLVEGEV